MRRVLPIVGVILAIVVAAGVGLLTGQASRSNGSTTPAAGGSFARLPTVSCKTTEGVPQASQPLPAYTTVPVAAGAAPGLSAYRDSVGTILVAPSGWRCKAIVAADGGEQISAYPASSPTPTQPHTSQQGDGATLIYDPACQGCVVGLICSYFPNASVVASYNFQACPAKPIHELSTRVGANVVLFHDPAGVSGQADPSGGNDPAWGALVFEPYAGPSAFQTSCTAPVAQAARCIAAISATLAARSP